MIPPTPVAAPIVRLDLEDGREPVADVDRAGVLARALQDARPLGRQGLEVHARALVAAVFGPHDREQAELRQIGLSAEQLDDARVLLARDAMPIEHFTIEGHQCAAS
jgi:hypothetical protein